MFKVKVAAWGHDAPKIRPETLEAVSPEDLKELVSDWLTRHCLGASNWSNPVVLKDNKVYGYMSYNQRIWDKQVWNANAREL
jgi:hypothetical protein